jgi:maleamate amidohydrolase
MAIWDEVLTERDKQVFAAAGYGKQQGFGGRPAIIVVDVNYNFVGEVPEPILVSIKTYRNSCGHDLTPSSGPERWALAWQEQPG